MLCGDTDLVPSCTRLPRFRVGRQSGRGLALLNCPCAMVALTVAGSDTARRNRAAEFRSEADHCLSYSVRTAMARQGPRRQPLMPSVAPSAAPSVVPSVERAGPRCRPVDSMAQYARVELHGHRGAPLSALRPGIVRAPLAAAAAAMGPPIRRQRYRARLSSARIWGAASAGRAATVVRRVSRSSLAPTEGARAEWPVWRPQATLCHRPATPPPGASVGAAHPFSPFASSWLALALPQSRSIRGTPAHPTATPALCCLTALNPRYPTPPHFNVSTRVPSSSLVARAVPTTHSLNHARLPSPSLRNTHPPAPTSATR